MTYSIVARDPETGKLGVAVQTGNLGVGFGTPWARAGVGAVATQAETEFSYGPLGLDGLFNNQLPSELLAKLIAADTGAEDRQVGMVDAAGHVAAHTGSKCVEYASHVLADGVSVQANLMLRDGVPDAMASAWNDASGEEFADRLLMCLDAAQLAGGDIRGMQSSAIKIVKAERFDQPWEGVEVDLRVEDAPDPLGELRRLVKLRRSFNLVRQGWELSSKGKLKESIQTFKKAESFTPSSEPMIFWHGMALAEHGEINEAKELLIPLMQKNQNWFERLKRLPKTGQVKENAELLADLQSSLE